MPLINKLPSVSLSKDSSMIFHHPAVFL